LASEVGYLIEVMLDPEVITTKATLTTLRQAALDQAAQAQAHAALRGSVPG
jgi:hypothetical protein